MSMKLADHLTDPKTAPSLRAFLEAALAAQLPAGGQLPLFATLKLDFSGRDFGGAIIKMKAGERVRVTDAGRFGDIGITLVLDEPKLYQARAVLAELADFSGESGTRSSPTPLVGLFADRRKT